MAADHRRPFALRRPFAIRFAFALAFLTARMLAAQPAEAADKRAEATAKEAILKAAADFTSADYATAAARLVKAAQTCGVNRCSRATKGLVQRDLGVMQFRLGDKAAADNSFTESLKADPDLEFPGKYEKPDVRAAWEHAKTTAAAATAAATSKGNAGKGAAGKGKPGAAGAAGAAGATPAPPAGSEEAPQQGDFTITPPTEQQVRTPLPIYVEFPGDNPPARVVAKYKGGSMSDWGKIELQKIDDGWGAVVPCTDVTRGPLRFWVQGLDKSGEPVASSGDPKHPFVVQIRPEISGESPSLPGKPPPEQCAKPEGEGGGGGTEVAGAPSGPRAKFHRFWVGLALSLDFLSMPSGKDVCALTGKGEPANGAELYCTNPNGSDFPTRATPAQNATLVQGEAGQVGGGLQAGDVRFMLSGDYAMNPNVLFGLRLGYVANAYPGKAAYEDGRAASFKIHFEARATYLFGQDAISAARVVPMAFGGFGLAEFDGHTSSLVTVSTMPGQEPVNVWRTDGPFFLLLGGGVRYLFTPEIAFTAALRLNLAVGNGLLPTIGPEVGLAYGF